MNSYPGETRRSIPTEQEENIVGDIVMRLINHPGLDLSYGSPTEQEENIVRDIVMRLINHPGLDLSYGRRLGLLESTCRLSSQDITGVVSEGILTSPRLFSGDKSRIAAQLLERRLDDLVMELNSRHPDVAASFDDDFLNYRRMIMALLRSSRKFEGLPETSRERLKAMITKTQSRQELQDFLKRVLERTCGKDTQIRIMDDVASHQYHRLLWSDRLDCDEGGKSEDIATRENLSAAPIQRTRLSLLGRSVEYSPIEHQSVFGDRVQQMINNSALDLSYVRRLALLESIRRLDDTTEIVLEGILTCPRLSSDDKHFLVYEGLLEHRWDAVFSYYRTTTSVVSFFDQDFLNLRRLVMVLLRTSNKFRHLPEDSRQRLKAMVVKTKTMEELDNLLMRVLERTCGNEIQARIMEDVTSQRYHRLLWSDRFDCDEDRSDEEDSKLPPVDAKQAATDNNMVYGSILLQDLPDELECCPICLDPVRIPALKLSCQHVFCSSCISGWIRTELRESGNASVARRESPSAGSHVMGWNCPMCRHSY